MMQNNVSLIKKRLIGLLTGLVDGSNQAKCVSLGNQKRITQPTLSVFVKIINGEKLLNVLQEKLHYNYLTKKV